MTITTGLAERSSEPPVDPFYYLGHFCTVLSSLEARYEDLMSAQERQFIAQFGSLPKASRALLVRMIMRRGDFFRASRLNYPEIGAAGSAVAPLLEIGWLDEPALDATRVHQLFSKAELIQYFAVPRPLRRLNKPDLGEYLRLRYPEPRPIQAWCGMSERVYQVLVKPLCEGFRAMFFGNFHQDWTDLVLADLGISSYEPIPSTHQSPPFRTRAHIDAFHQLYGCRQLLDAGVELDQVFVALAPPITDSEWLEEQRQELLFQIARAYERAGRRDSALALFSTCAHRGSRIRAARIHERAGDWQAARELCRTARQNPENQAERQQIERLLARLNRKLGASREKATDALGVLVFELVLDAPRDGRAVEYHVREHLTQETEEHSTVHYVENGLVNSLFGLLCWEAIFAPIPGAFFHDFQQGPADLGSPHFYRRREREFQECLGQLESDRYKTTIRERFVAKSGLQSPFIAWGLLNERLMECALSCFPALHLRLWFDWIARDVQVNRAGFPDLVQFWPRERRYRLVEVKGPGDRLQDNQRRFLEFCILNDLPVSVCRVRWAEQRSA